MFCHFCYARSAWPKSLLRIDAVAVREKVFLHYIFFHLKALKVLRTSEFLPYVVFIEAPDFEVLKAMNRSAIESGVVTKQLTVRACMRVCMCVCVCMQMCKCGFVHVSISETSKVFAWWATIGSIQSIRWSSAEAQWMDFLPPLKKIMEFIIFENEQ